MSNNTLVSVIIPVFNLEKVIKKCVSSVMQQTYKDIEIIIVNDGSQDNSLAVSQSLAQQDERIRIHTQTNAGELPARKTGYELADGKWIVYVDGDDWLPDDAVENLVQTAEAKNADVVIGDMVTVYDGRGWRKRFERIRPNGIMNNREFNHEEFMEELYISYFGEYLLPVNMVRCIYKKTLISKAKMKFYHLRRSGDVIFNMQCLPHADKIATIPDVVYYYRYGGGTSRLNKDLMNDAITAYNFKKEMIEKYQFDKARPYIARELTIWLQQYADELLIHAGIGKKKFIEIISEEMKRPEMREAVFVPAWDEFHADEMINCIKREDAEKYYSLIKKTILKKKLHKLVYGNYSRIFR